MIPKLIAKFTNSLALGVETSSTEMLLSSTVSRDNQTIPSGTYGFVINRGQENEEFCIGSYVAGTVTFTARGLSYLDGITEITANKKKHRKGDPVEMTTHPALTYIAKMLAGDIDLDGILKYPATRLINNQRQLVDKEYADNIVSSQITALKVSADGALTVAVNTGYYSLNGVITYYAGSVGNALADDAVNYIQLNDGVLSINSVGFTEGAMPLAKITTASGAITISEDARAVLGWLDIKTNSGIGRDSTGLFVDLATDPGLEFSSGKLKAKIDPAGGLSLSASGLGIGSTAAVVTATLGENITISSYPKPVFLADSESPLFSQGGYLAYFKSYSSEVNIYTTNQGYILFRTGTYMTRLQKIRTSFCKYGSPAGNFTASLYLADVNGKPTGSALASVTISASALTSQNSGAFTYWDFVPSSVLSVSPNTLYCLVGSAPSAASTSACVKLNASTATGSTYGTSYKHGSSSDSGVSWTLGSEVTQYLEVYGYSDLEEGKLYLSDLTDYSRQKISGFLENTGLSGASKTIKLNGLVNGFSNLEIGENYFLDSRTEVIGDVTNNTSYQFGYSTEISYGQTITVGSRGYISTVDFYVAKANGTPTDNLVVEVYTAPGGTLLATSSPVVGSSLTNSKTRIPFTLNIHLTPGTQYYFKVKRTGALDSSNYYQIWGGTSNTYSGGTRYYNDSSASGDLNFWLNGSSANGLSKAPLGPFAGRAVTAETLMLGDFRGLISSESFSILYADDSSLAKTVPVPLQARRVLFVFTYARQSSTETYGQMWLEKDSVSSSSFAYFDSYAYGLTASFTSAGFSTVKAGNGSISSGAYISGTLYFFN